jgi:hypothetical protein
VDAEDRKLEYPQGNYNSIGKNDKKYNKLSDKLSG